jgi:hypothetical protein
MSNIAEDLRELLTVALAGKERTPEAASKLAAVVVTTILSDHEIVELPEAEFDDFHGSVWPAPGTNSRGMDGQVHVLGTGRIAMDSVANPLPDAAAARALAGALLAAAQWEEGLER